MRTNIDIDDNLIHEAMLKTGARTKKAVVEAGLRSLLDIQAQAGIRELYGKVKWEGNLEESRLGRNVD